MREKLNTNPIAQLALIGGLGLVVAFIMMRNLGGGSEPAAEEPAPSSAAASAAPATTGSDPATDTASADAAAAATATDAATGAPVTSAGTDPTAPVPTSDTASVAAPEAKFNAGPGLPEAVVDAYDSGAVVVLLVTRHRGDADRKLREAAEALRLRDDVAMFGSSARNLSKYSRIAQGVDLNRVPALIALRPQRLTRSGLPEASVSYGYRGPDSVLQVVRDASYKGRSDIPYYPE